MDKDLSKEVLEQLKEFNKLLLESNKTLKEVKDILITANQNSLSESEKFISSQPMPKRAYGDSKKIR